MRRPAVFTLFSAVFAIVPVAGFALLASGCRDLQGFSTAGDHFEGAVVPADFVRSGVDAGTRLCLTLDTNHLQDTPGTITSDDGRFKATALRPIPQLWHDPLSTLNFGEGRIQNLIYAASPTADAGDAQDMLVVISLLQSKAIELRLLRGAPGGGPGAAFPVFGVFALERESGPCLL